MCLRWTLFGAIMLVQVVFVVASDNKKNAQIDRGVFLSAKELAVDCQILKGTVGEDDVLAPSAKLPASTQDAMAAGRCVGYIVGVADEFREVTGTHYRPISAGRGELPLLIDAFLKRVADHPNEADLAASTVLHEADHDVLSLCGDCGFGFLVRRH